MHGQNVCFYTPYERQGGTMKLIVETIEIRLNGKSGI